MKEIHIECAGAGKTYGIAQRIIEVLPDCPDGQKIYAITYTNYAVSQIEQEIKKQLHNTSDKLIVETVHHFLLEHIIYPYSHYVKEDEINTCSVEPLPSKFEWRAKRISMLKKAGIIHSSVVPDYARSIVVPLVSDKPKIKERKRIIEGYYLCDIFALFVDEAQDMEKSFFDLMIHVLPKIDNFYFVGDPYQALRTSDYYEEFAKTVEHIPNISLHRNSLSRRIPKNVIPLCNRILPETSRISSSSEIDGVVEYLLLSDLGREERYQLTVNPFTIIKERTEVFSTSNKKFGFTHEFSDRLSARFPEYDLDAIKDSVTETIINKGLDECLKELGIRLEKQDYARLAAQISCIEGTGLPVKSIQKMKGLESWTVFLIVCNSLLEILLGIRKQSRQRS